MVSALRIVAVALAIALVRLAHAAPADLDPTFGVGGTVIGLPPPFAEVGLIEGVIQPDGKILAAGNSLEDGLPTITVVRFETDGTLDPTFGGDGIATAPLGDGNDTAFAITLQGDGRILVAGDTERVNTPPASSDMVVVRFLADGTLDPSFGDGGAVRTSFGPELDVATSIAWQPNGKIVIAGTTYVAGNPRFALARFEADGSSDLTFGTGGKVDTSFRDGDSILAMALQPDGKMVVGGYSEVSGDEFPAFDAAFARYRPDGTLDADFGSGGLVVVSLGEFSFTGLNDLTLQGDGRIIGAGAKGVGGQALLVRLDADGALDATFGTGGIVTTATSGAAIADAVIVQPDGRVVAAGVRYTSTPGDGTDPIVLRMDDAGGLDAGFGVGGAVVTHTGGYDLWRAVRRQTDGKLIVFGAAFATTATELAMARYEGTPAACGNGVSEPPETCDDGNVTASDGCDTNCAVEAGYACVVAPSVCTTGCGDGAVAGSEACDDADGDDGDGCDAACRIEPGWTCTGSPSACASVCGDSRIVGAEQCDDGNATGGDCCDASCQFEAAGSPCLDEGVFCSNDVCGGGGVCQHELAPDPTCLVPTEPGKAQLKILVRGPGKDQVQFKWAKGPAVPKAAFGVPASATPRFGICIYDESAGTPGLALGVVADGDDDCDDGACWIEKPSGWQLKNKAGAPGGIVQLKLQQGLVPGKSKVQVTMKGAALTAPSLPLANDPHVVAQVRTSDGQCYGATFATPKVNDGAKYQAKSE